MRAKKQVIINQLPSHKFMFVCQLAYMNISMYDSCVFLGEAEVQTQIMKQDAVHLLTAIG